MIRRLFWLVLGAVLGVSGYRKATALARSLRPVPCGAARRVPSAQRIPYTRAAARVRGLVVALVSTAAGGARAVR